MRLLRSILYRLYAIYDKACPLRYFIQKIRLYYAKNVICRSGSRFANTVFEGDNLVANGVQIEAWSVEDEGSGICFNVFCYNVQPGIDIDYANGDSEISPDYTGEVDNRGDNSG